MRDLTNFLHIVGSKTKGGIHSCVEYHVQIYMVDTVEDNIKLQPIYSKLKTSFGYEDAAMINLTSN